MDNPYVNFTPYDQQLAEVQRRQRLADLMQQQAMAPIDVPQSGRLVTPVSPVLGLAKLLQGYMAGKAQRDVAQRQAALGQSDLQTALGMVDRLQAGKPTEVSPQAALEASMGGGTMATPQPTPFSQPERQAMLTRSMLTGGPRTQAIAQMLMKPTEGEFYDAVPVTVDGVTKMVQYSKTGGAPRVLEGQKYEKPTAPPTATATIMKGGRKVVVNIATGEEVGEAPAEYHAPSYEPLAKIIGADGKPIFVRQSQAIGKTPYSETGEKPLTEAQANAAGFAVRLASADKIISESKFVPNIKSDLAARMPYSSKFMSEEQQKFDQAKRDFINAQLRRESGATIQPPEFESAEKQYFPQPGESEGSKKQKAKARRIAIENMQRSAGQNFSFPIQLDTETETNTPPPGAVVRVK